MGGVSLGERCPVLVPNLGRSPLGHVKTPAQLHLPLP